jgi:1-acyl-sn-glycerol-3-phosphate acyltransferase
MGQTIRVPNKKLRKPGYGEKLGATWYVIIAVLYAPVSLLFKTRYRNIQKFPQSGPVLVVLNHVAHVDPLIVSKFVIDAARRPRFLAKKAIFDVPLVGLFMRSSGQIPVDRGTTDAAKAFRSAVDALQAGGVIVMHPEGTVTRDPDGWPMEGKTGAARLASLVPGVPVIPVSQWGVQEQVDFYAKRFKFFPRPRHVVGVGEPIDLSEFEGKQADAATLRAMTDVIMRRLRADVAELRGVPAPDGPLFHWVRPPKAAK